MGRAIRQEEIYYIYYLTIYYVLFIFDGGYFIIGNDIGLGSMSGWRGSSGAEIALNIAVIPSVERVYLIPWSTTENTVQGSVVVY